MYINILPDAILANPITAKITVTDCYRSINRLFLVTMETTVLANLIGQSANHDSLSMV